MGPFDEDAINQFLGHPLVLEEGQHYEFSLRRSQASGFDKEAIGQLLYIPGEDFAQSVMGRRVRIMRTSMTTLTQICMTLLLNNILPSDHNFLSSLAEVLVDLCHLDPGECSCGLVDLIHHLSIYRDHASQTPSGPRKVQQSTGVSGLDHGPLPVLWGVGYSHKAYMASH